ncbi:MAG: hypothetical protein IJZ93_00100 [Clostridia bacterium]|nr:hypothetical protein [Clostridia bacterium]
MKKALSLIFAFVMLLSLAFMTSCSKEAEEMADFNGKTPIELIENAEKQINQNKNYHITIEQVYKTEGTPNIERRMTATEMRAGSEKYYYTRKYDDSAAYTQTYVDGILYTDNGSKKVKYPLSKEEFASRTSISLFIAKNYFKDKMFTKDGDGVTVKAVLEGEGLEYISTAYGKTCLKAEYSFSFDEHGTLSKITSEVSFDCGEYTETTSQTTSVVTFGTINISAPSDADQYLDIEG